MQREGRKKDKNPRISKESTPPLPTTKAAARSVPKGGSRSGGIGRNKKAVSERASSSLSCWEECERLASQSARFFPLSRTQSAPTQPISAAQTLPKAGPTAPAGSSAPSRTTLQKSHFHARPKKSHSTTTASRDGNGFNPFTSMRKNPNPTRKHPISPSSPQISPPQPSPKHPIIPIGNQSLIFTLSPKRASRPKKKDEFQSRLQQWRHGLGWWPSRARGCGRARGRSQISHVAGRPMRLKP